MRLIANIAQAYARNIIYSFRLTRTNSWGYSHNGTFDGMVGALERREVDIGGSPVFIREERSRVIDVVVPTWLAR